VRYKYLTSCSCLLTPPHPSVTHTLAHVINLTPPLLGLCNGPAIKASAYGSRVDWTPARRIHTYIHGLDCMKLVHWHWWAVTIDIIRILDRVAGRSLPAHQMQQLPLPPPSSCALVKSSMAYLSGACLPSSSWKKGH